MWIYARKRTNAAVNPSQNTGLISPLKNKSLRISWNGEISNNKNGCRRVFSIGCQHYLNLGLAQLSPNLFICLWVYEKERGETHFFLLTSPLSMVKQFKVFDTLRIARLNSSFSVGTPWAYISVRITRVRGGNKCQRINIMHFCLTGEFKGTLVAWHWICQAKVLATNYCNH